MKRNHSRIGRSVGEALVLLTMIIIAAPVAAQQPASPEVGIYGAYQLVQHDANITGMPGVPCCAPEFDGGTGGGFTAGALYRMPFSPMLGLDLRLGYAYFGGGLRTEENIGNAMEGGETVDAMVEHTIDVGIGMLMFEPRLSIAPFSFPLIFNVGMQAGYPFLASEFHQSERLLTPRGATFTNGSTTRNDTTGEFPAAENPLFGAIVGMRYDIPVGAKFRIGPEVSYHYNFGSILEAEDWAPHALRLGATFTYSLGSDLNVSAPDALPDLPLAATVSASGLYADSSETPIIQVRVEEFLGSQLRPLLPYVFFDQGSATMPARYNRMTPDEARAFRVEGVHRNTALETYHQLLNIIGRRMIELPQSKIRLVGTNDGTSTETGSGTLSRRRAESVRDYLRDVWGIAPERMAIESRNLPEKPSNGETREGAEENRRVEIIADNLRVTEPVMTNDTTRSADPPAVRFRTSARADAGLASWKLVASQSGRTIREIGGPGPIPPSIDWQFDQRSMPSIPVPIDYALTVVDANGRSYTTPLAAIPTNQVTIQRKRTERIADREISRYSLILFDFNSTEISDANRRIVDMIRNRITLAADVTITGYTDRLGDAAHNATLALQRAQKTEQALGTTKATVRGIGESNLHDNNLPEGRFYSRVVDVVVETPIE